MEEQDHRRQEDLGKLPPTFNFIIWKAIIGRRRYDRRPRRIWGSIQCHRSHNGRIVYYRIDCLLRRACNSSRDKVAGVGRFPQPIVNRKPPTPSSDSILWDWERALHAAPSRIYHSAHHQHPAPGPAPMDRKRNVSAAGTIPKEDSPQRIPTGRTPTCIVQPLPQYSIISPRTPIPGTSTHGCPGWLCRTLPRKTWSNRKHTGNPHQQDQTIQQYTLLFYMCIWCGSPQKCMPSLQYYTSYAQHLAWRGTHLYQPGSNHGST